MSTIYRSPFAHGVNTCYAPLLLRKDMLDQLAFLKEYCGFRTVRCHGIFHDHIGVASRGERRRLEFHFELAHKVYDNLLDIGLRPHIELSFLPRVLAADPNRTCCYYQAHVSQPRLYAEWSQLVAAFSRSLLRRYGRRETAGWRFEVWNEPNLRGFREGQNSAPPKSFVLYTSTDGAVPAADAGENLVGNRLAPARHAP